MDKKDFERGVAIMDHPFYSFIFAMYDHSKKNGQSAMVSRIVTEFSCLMKREKFPYDDQIAIKVLHNETFEALFVAAVLKADTLNYARLQRISPQLMKSTSDIYHGHASKPAEEESQPYLIPWSVMKHIVDFLGYDYGKKDRIAGDFAVIDDKTLEILRKLVADVHVDNGSEMDQIKTVLTFELNHPIRKEDDDESD